MLSTGEQQAIGLTGARYAVAVAHLLLSAATIEGYVIVRDAVARDVAYPTLALAAYLLTSAAFIALAALSIGVACLAPFADGEPRLWLTALAALGAAQALIVYGFPPAGERDWTEAEIIRLFAQESPRYARWLLVRQVLLGLAEIAAWVGAVAIFLALSRFGWHVADATLLAVSAPPMTELARILRDAAVAAAPVANVFLPALTALGWSVYLIGVAAALIRHSRSRPKPGAVQWPED